MKWLGRKKKSNRAAMIQSVISEWAMAQKEFDDLPKEALLPEAGIDLLMKAVQRKKKAEEALYRLVETVMDAK